MTTLMVKDLTQCKELDGDAMAAVQGGLRRRKKRLALRTSSPSARKPGTQADITRLSTSLFGGPIFPGLDPEFP